MNSSAQEITFAMIKPDATARNLIGSILQILEKGGLKLKAGRLLHIEKSVCEAFYAEHKEKPFFSSLVEYVLSGPVFVMALSGPSAITHLRKIIGHTDPAKALPGTIRALYGKSIEQNSIHASDSPASAKKELKLFFKEIQ